MARKKVTIVGAGMTGGAMAQRLVERDVCDVVLQDDPQFAGTMHFGKALDEAQAAAWTGFSASIRATDGWEETAGSDVVVLTAGAPRKPGMSREELLNGNAAIVRDKARQAAAASPDAVLVVFSNPMDAMCHVALEASGFPAGRASCLPEPPPVFAWRRSFRTKFFGFHTGSDPSSNSYRCRCRRSPPQRSSFPQLQDR